MIKISLQIIIFLNLLILFLTAFGVIFNSSAISLISYSKNLNNNIFNKIELDFFNLYNKLSFSIWFNKSSTEIIKIWSYVGLQTKKFSCVVISFSLYFLSRLKSILSYSYSSFIIDSGDPRFLNINSSFLFYFYILILLFGGYRPYQFPPFN